MCSAGDKKEECPSVGVTRYCPCPWDLRVQQLVRRLVDTNIKNLVLRLPAKSSSSMWFPVNLRSQPPPSFPSHPLQKLAESLLPSLSGSEKVRNNNRNKVKSRWDHGLHSCTKLLLLA